MLERKDQLINEKITKLLVEQLAHELMNYNLYKTFANYYGVEGIIQLENYYHERAHEEYTHHDWIYHFLTEADIKFVYPSIPSNNVSKIDNFVKPFELTVVREIETTNLIYKIHDACVQEGDIMTASWLYEKLIKEQIEEENTSRAALAIMRQDADIFERAKRVYSLLTP